MSVVSQILAFSASIYPASTVLLASKFKASRATFDFSASQFPLILIDNEIKKSNEIKLNNNILKGTRLIISVLDRMDTFSTDSAIIARQDQLELMADTIIANIYQQTNVRQIGGQSYTTTPVFNYIVKNLVGVSCEVTFNDNLVINFINKYTT